LIAALITASAAASETVIFDLSTMTGISPALLDESSWVAAVQYSEYTVVVRRQLNGSFVM